MREELNNILMKHTGKALEQIEKDTDRDFFMSGVQAKEYGLVDQVISGREGVRG
jgi:ATP-dependent Clp protease protease subunit